MEIRKVSEIVWREDLYPRIKPDAGKIQNYSENIDVLPPIEVNQANILIDGYHRWKAHELAGQTDIKADVIEVATEKELKKLAYRYNAVHGLQLTSEEKQGFANEMITESSVTELAVILSVSERIVEVWTKTKRANLDTQRDQRIFEEYLRAWTSQKGIGDTFGISQAKVS
jgi:ribosome-binding ATPase YchF (GTP1/OBG family)